MVFVATHFYTLIRYDLLAENIRQFCDDLAATNMPEADRRRCRQLLGDGMVDKPGDEVDGCRKRDCAKPFVFVVALDGRVLARPGRQIRCRGGDRLNARLLIVGDHSDGPLCLRQCAQHFRCCVDFQNFGLALVEGRVTAFQIITHLVGLDWLAVQVSCTVLAATSARQP